MKVIFTLISFIVTTVALAQQNINDLERINDRWTLKGEQVPYTGSFIETFHDGKLKSKGELNEGLLTGARIIFFENGDTSSFRFYKNGLSHGKSLAFYSNGTKKEEGVFNEGKEEGRWFFYHENGQKKAIVNFKNRVLNGEFEEFDSKGNLTRKFFYENGEAGYGKVINDLVTEALKFDRKFESEKAIPLYNQAIMENPTIAHLYFNRGSSKQNMFDFEGAILDYNKAIELEPKLMQAYSNRGYAKTNLYTTKGNLNPTPSQTESACEDFHKAIELGDTTVGTQDMIYIHCKEFKKKN
jgi:tetratricopeptide (TPR) repeat protein